MKAVKNMFTATVTLCAADLTASGYTSLGINHPIGPHDHANPATYTHTNSTMHMAYCSDMAPVPLSPNCKVFDGMRACLGDDHLGAALEEERSAADLVGGHDGDEGGEDVDEAGDDGGDEGGVLAEADGLEEDGGVEHDDVDAGELLEEGDEQRERELRLELAAEEELPPRVRHRLALLARRRQVLELGAHVVDAADLGQRRAGHLAVAAHDEGDGRVRDGQRPQRDEGRRHRAERQPHPPAPPAGDLRRPVVRQARRQDPHRDHQLEQDVQHPP
uniref:Uncharacterized protein n=1 Tax=Oryza brachyantha TaxID=4533 RepID=J3L9S6_ORYBR